MIVKSRKPSLQLLTLQAMKRRVRKNHEMYDAILNELGKREAGLYGENSLDYFINLLPETSPSYHVLHDLRLPYKNTYFQIDTLIIFPSCLLIIEIKNNRGTVYFDPRNNQVIQEVEDLPPKSLPDPILQVTNQAYKLKKWIEKRHCSSLSIDNLVVLTNPNVIVKVTSSPGLVEKHVVKSPALLGKVRAILNKYDVN
ncbi:nuclease-related domain-containing protein [Sutcliffiella rhizosphaerae]|uniref:NERD domain-containing protein n=1 Tax=Sutcliffiella rhizosphaerae TaxID=2880967 RepID=A0ABN8AH34_9BACI|nr:nuclease-related domain-containing protein [Sutcliffiella rhizosphaerae]CAG9622165.1 hypothetical protein BACCIP111883_02956 [Sutcliffiella rhizosphaerae]